jgi:replicative DNA helicase
LQRYFYSAPWRSFLFFNPVSNQLTMATPDPVREQSLERALPNSAEAERAILGGVVLDNGLISQAIELLRPEDFYVPSHRRIFMAMIALFERGAEINPILIGEELKKENALESVGGISFITNLTYGLPHSTNIAHYAKVVRGKSMLRQLIKASNKITQEALEQEDEPEIILDHAEQAIFQLADERIRQGFVHVKPVAEQLLEKIQEMEGRAAVLTGLTTGFADLDKMTSGLQRQDLVIVAARPSMGKTSFALMLAENAAIHAGAVVGIFSLEMSKEALVMRMLCSQGNIDAQRFRNGFLSRPEWAQIAKSLGTLADARIFLDDSAGITVLEMRAKSRRLAAEQKKLDLIIVDYLQLMSGSAKRFESRQQEVSQISRELKGLAKEMNVPVVALSQLSRAPESRSDHRPQLADLRESGALEQDADVVAFIYREEQYKTPEERNNLPEDQKNVAELIVAKQRNGPTGTVDLRFTPSSMRFDNLYRE